MDRSDTPPARRFLVVVTAYDRSLALGRLLESLGRLKPAGFAFDLVISIDGGGDPHCRELAEAFRWEHGSQQVVVHPERLGLRAHMEGATDRVSDYDAVVVLEDDLTVSPWALRYCAQAFDAYGDRDEIAQISLYCHQINEAGLPFMPVHHGGDVWFARVPSSWGQMVGRRQWQAYREWSRQRVDHSFPENMPPAVQQWQHTWKRGFFEYISLHRLWVAYPYHSLSTNHGDVGANHLRQANDLQAPLELVARDYHWSLPAHGKALYDEWLEPLPETFDLALPAGARLEVDLCGTKPLARLHGRLLLSTRPCVKPIARFSTELVPLEMNVRLGRAAIGDDAISLGRAEDFGEGDLALRIAAGRVARAIVAASAPEPAPQAPVLAKPRGRRGLRSIFTRLGRIFSC